MNTVKWRRVSIAAAFAVAGSVLFAVIVAVSPDAAEAGRSGSDTTPPGRSDGSPTGTLPAGTTSATLALTTDEAATCRYSTTAGVAYSRMKDTFSTTGGRSHATAVGGLRDGNTFTFYVRCRDLARNANPDDYAIRFTVQSRDDCGTPSATAHGTWTAAGGASNPPSSGPAGTWAFVPSPSVESASPSIVVDNTLQGIEAIAPDDVWTVGYANNPDGPQYSIQTLALHWDGGSWSRVPSPNPNAGFASNELYGIATFSPDDIWAVGVSGNSTHPYAPLALHWDGASWSAISTDGLGGGAYGSFFRSVSGTSSGDMLAVGATVFDAGFEGGIRHVAFAAHWDGATWTQITDFTFVDPGEYYSSTNFYGVSMVASDFGWVVGEASGDAWLFHWDGTSLNEVAASELPWYNTLYAVDALSRDVAWAAGRYAIEVLSGTKPLTEMYSVS